MIPVRRALPADAPELVRLRALMFEAMGIASGDDAWMASAETHFARELSGPHLVAFVADAPDGAGGLAASGVVEVQPRIPGPANPSGRRAYISSMSTDPRWRRQGLARCILRALLEETGRRDVALIDLHATADAVALYREEGLGARSGALEMRWAAAERRRAAGTG